MGCGHAAFDHGPVGAISAEGHDAGHPVRFHDTRRSYGVFLVSLQREVQREYLRRDLDGIQGTPHDAEVVGHVTDALYPNGRKPQQHAADDADLFLVVEHAPIGHQPADVLPGGGVCDDPDKRQVRPFSAYRSVYFPTTVLTASMICDSLGMYACSRGWEKGTGQKGAATRRIGASR